MAAFVEKRKPTFTQPLRRSHHDSRALTSRP